MLETDHDLIVRCYNSRESWMAEAGPRQPDYRFGATACAAILGVSEWQKPWDVWAAAHAPELLPEREETEDQTRGLWWESRILEWYDDHRHMEVEGGLCRAWRPEHDWLRVSPDAFVRPGSTDFPWGLAEVKTQRRRDGWGKDGMRVGPGERTLGILPPTYATQVYAQLAGTGLPWCDVVVMFSITDIRVIRVWADEARQAWILDQVGEWRERHLVGGDMPDPQDSGVYYAALKNLDRDGWREATPDEAALAETYHQSKLVVKRHEKWLKTARNHLIGAMGEHRAIVSPTHRVTVDSRGALTVKKRGTNA